MICLAPTVYSSHWNFKYTFYMFSVPLLIGIKLYKIRHKKQNTSWSGDGMHTTTCSDTDKEIFIWATGYVNKKFCQYKIRWWKCLELKKDWPPLLYIICEKNMELLYKCLPVCVYAYISLQALVLTLNNKTCFFHGLVVLHILSRGVTS
jgi:hypothetical protein